MGWYSIVLGESTLPGAQIESNIEAWQERKLGLKILLNDWRRIKAQVKIKKLQANKEGHWSYTELIRNFQKSHF